MIFRFGISIIANIIGFLTKPQLIQLPILFKKFTKVRI